MKQLNLTIRLTVLIILTSVYSCYAKPVAHPKIYKINVHLMKGGMVKGYLYKANSQKIYFMASVTSLYVDSIKAEEIKKISIRRNGKIGRSLAIGTVTGGLAAGVAGIVTFSPCPGGCILGPSTAAETGLFLLIPGAISGLIIGTIAGIFNNSSQQINGNLATYINYLPKLKKYALEKEQIVPKTALTKN